jgi:serine/threonine protein kinase
MSAPASIHIQGHTIPIDDAFKLTVSEIYDGESYDLSFRLGDPSESGNETTFSDGTTFKQRIVNRASSGALGDRITAGSFGAIYKLTIPPPAVMSHGPYLEGPPKLSGTFTVKVLSKITEEAVYRELQGLIAVYNLPCCSQLRAAIASFDGVYILMDWVEGVTYDKLTSSEAKAHVDAQLGPCLAAIHEKGILHRDIKPNNIIVGNGRPTFIDFGLSAVIGEPDMGPVGPRQYRHPRYDGSKSQDIGLDIEALNQVIAGTQFSASEFRGGGRRNKRKSQIKKTTKTTKSQIKGHKEKAKKRTQKRLRR